MTRLKDKGALNNSKRVVDTNDEILGVYDTLSSYERVLENNGKVIGNIYKVFIHDLMIHFSSIFIQRVGNGLRKDKAEFPFVDESYAVNPVDVQLNSQFPADQDWSISRWARAQRLLPIGLGNAIPFGYKKNRALSKLVNLLGEHQFSTKVVLPSINMQMDNLYTCIEHICRNHSIKNVSTIQKNWDKYIQFHSKEEPESLDNRLVIVGARQNLQNRKLAINYLSQGKEVVALTHGEITSQIFDEPMYLYAERGLCTTLVEYGERFAGIKSEKVMNKPHKVLYRSSKTAKDIFRPCNKIWPKELKTSKVLYIPTTYVGAHIYGPFHAYEDNVYWEWQKALSRVVPSIVVKQHPKSRASYSLSVRTETRWLEDCIEDYEILVLDYVSTGLALAMLTAKPVLYFDIGLRRIQTVFKDTIKRRCHYVSVDINGNLEEQIEYGMNTYAHENSSYSNEDIGRFSITQKETFKWHNLVSNLIEG